MVSETLVKSEKSKDIRHRNIAAGIAVADSVRTSLGPKGMDKMIKDARGSVIITNDGATIMNKMLVDHPIGKMLVEVSKTQDIEAGDGTTSVVVTTGGLLRAAETLLDKGIHPQAIAESFLKAQAFGEKVLEDAAIPLSLNDRETLIKNASTSLNSKVVSQSSALLAPIAVDAVLKVMDPKCPGTVDLNNIKIVKKLGGTVDDTTLVDGLVFPNNKVSRAASGPIRVENAKIGLIQFCLSAPKTNLENNITIRDYSSMDRILREERLHIAKMIKQIASTGCNVLLVQKSIIRDAVTDLSVDFLAKAKILLIRDVERDEIDFISKTLGCEPVADISDFTADKLGKAELVCEKEAGGSRITHITGVPGKNAASIFVRASNQLMLDEADRSIHDALCVVRALVKKQAVLPGGSAPEMMVSSALIEYARTLEGAQQICVRTFAEALEIIPYTLAENCGLHPIDIVAALRRKHANGEKYSGINVKKGTISDMYTENVVQPLLVSTSALQLATETVMLILKIDDIVLSR